MKTESMLVDTEQVCIDIYYDPYDQDITLEASVPSGEDEDGEPTYDIFIRADYTNDAMLAVGRYLRDEEGSWVWHEHGTDWEITVKPKKRLLHRGNRLKPLIETAAGIRPSIHPTTFSPRRRPCPLIVRTI